MLAHKNLVIGAAYASTFALAQVKPTTPGPGEVYNAGSNCTVAWERDSSQRWTNVSIDLMSGSNTNMSLVTNVVSSLDGTNSSKTSHTWTCPEVDPYSAIYFYQFTNGNEVTNRTWTTRFTIASPKNETVPPEHAQQPDGSPVPWGTGHLIGEERTSHSRLQTENIVLVNHSRIATVYYYISSSDSSGHDSSDFEGARKGSIAGMLPSNVSVARPHTNNPDLQDSSNIGAHDSGPANFHSGAYRAFSIPRSWSIPFTAFSALLALTSLT